jgi:hypothetical protein
LLADFLIYATKSCDTEHYKKSESVYKTLQSLRPQLWDWKIYDFSIDYLLHSAFLLFGVNKTVKEYRTWVRLFGQAPFVRLSLHGRFLRET